MNFRFFFSRVIKEIRISFCLFYHYHFSACVAEVRKIEMRALSIENWKFITLLFACVTQYLEDEGERKCTR